MAILVRVTTEHPALDRPTAGLWIVATDDPQIAVESVRPLAPAGAVIVATDLTSPEDAVQRLGITPGHARPL